MLKSLRDSFLEIIFCAFSLSTKFSRLCCALSIICIGLGDDAKIELIGTPEKVINAFGPEVIGENVEGKVISMNVAEHAGRTYYQFELEPPHALITATAAGNRLYLFNITANGRDTEAYFNMVHNKPRQSSHIFLLFTFVGLQWKRHYSNLKRIADSFRVI